MLVCVHFVKSFPFDSAAACSSRSLFLAWSGSAVSCELFHAAHLCSPVWLLVQSAFSSVDCLSFSTMAWSLCSKRCLSDITSFSWLRTKLSVAPPRADWLVELSPSDGLDSSWGFSGASFWTASEDLWRRFHSPCSRSGLQLLTWWWLLLRGWRWWCWWRGFEWC